MLYITENVVDFFTVHRTGARDFKEGMGGMGAYSYHFRQLVNF